MSSVRRFAYTARSHSSTVSWLLVALGLCFGSAYNSAKAQALMVLPVNIQMTPGQRAATLTVTNKGDQETAVQLRAFAWDQHKGEENLTPSDAVLVSPPISTIPAGGTQVVRLILRQPPEGKEATYRIVLDQIPPPAIPGIVRVVLRISIPVFAQPTTRALPHMQFRLEHKDGKDYLLVLNDGNRHEVLRDITLLNGEGYKTRIGAGYSPYILAGAVRRWQIDSSGYSSAAVNAVHLKARGDAGVIDQKVQVGTP